MSKKNSTNKIIYANNIARRHKNCFGCWAEVDVHMDFLLLFFPPLCVLKFFSLPSSYSSKHKGQLNWHQVKLVFCCHFSGHHLWQLCSRWFGPSHVTVFMSALRFTLQKSLLSAPIQFDRSCLHLQAGAVPPWQDLSQHSSHHAQPDSNFTQRQVCYDDF